MSSILPADFFGLHGLGSAARGIASGIEQNRELEALRQQRATDEAGRQLQLAITMFGKDSPQVQQIMELQGQRLLPGMNLEGAEVAMSSQELLDKRIARAVQNVDAGTATPEDVAIVNQKITGRFGGAAGGMRAENLEAEAVETGIAATEAGTESTRVNTRVAQYDLDQKKQFNATIEALRNHPRFARDLEGVPEGGVLGYFTVAELQQGLQKGSAEISLINANIRAANAQAAKYQAEAREAGKTQMPGTKEWFERYVATSSLPPGLLAKGFYAYDTLSPEEKQLFDADYSQFYNLTQAELQRRITDAQASGDPSAKLVIDMVSAEQAARAKGTPTLGDNEYHALLARMYNMVSPGAVKKFTPGEVVKWGKDIPIELEVSAQVLAGLAGGTIAQQMGAASPGEGQNVEGQLGVRLPPEDIGVTAQFLVSQGIELDEQRRALLDPRDVAAIEAEMSRIKGTASPAPAPVGVQTTRTAEPTQAAAPKIDKMDVRQLVTHIDSLKSQVAGINEQLNGEISVKQANGLFKERDRINKELRKAQDRFYQVSREEAATRAEGTQPFALPTSGGITAPQIGAELLNQQAPIPEPINQRGAAAAESTGATVGSGTPMRQIPSIFQPQPFGVPGEVLPRDPVTNQVTQDSLMREIVKLTREADASPKNKALLERLGFLRRQLRDMRGVR